MIVKHKKKPERRTLWFTMRKCLLVDHTTGEVLGPVKALVARDGITRRLLKKRRYHVGDELKGDIKKGRRYSQWKRAHKLGQLMHMHVEGFPEDAHECIKRLQRESGLKCDVVRMAAKPVVDALVAAVKQSFGVDVDLGLLADVKEIDTIEPQSLSYDAMDEGEFDEFYDELCKFICLTYWKELTPEQIAEQAELMVDD